MKNKLTEQLPNVTITDVKRNHSIHSEYYSANDPIAGSKGKDGLDDLNLGDITLGDQNPDLLRDQKQRDDVAEIALAQAEKDRIALEEANKNKGGEVDNDKGDRDTPEEVKLDEQGNQIDVLGNIIKTKEVLDQEQAKINEANYVPLINEIISTSGVEIIGEDGKPKVYEDSVEGILQYNNDLAELKARKNEEELFKRFPKLKNYLEAQIKGIPDSDYFGSRLADWKNIEIDETNLDQQLDIVVKGFEARGIDKDRAVKMAQRIKDSGKDVLLEESKLSLTDLQGIQTSTEKEKTQKQEEYNRIQEEKITSYWKKVNEVVISGKLEEYTIPESDRKAFNDFVSLAADDNGNSAAMIARDKMSLEQKLLLDYYVFKGGNLDALAKTTLGKQKVNSLRNRIVKINTTTQKGSDNNEGQVKFNDLKLENIQRT